MSDKMSIENDVFELIAQHKQGKTTLKDLGLTRTMIASMLEKPEIWQDYLTTRTNEQLHTRRDLIALDAAFSEDTGMSYHQVRTIVKALKLYPLRPSNTGDLQQERKEYYQRRKNLAYTLAKVIRGVVTVDSAAKEAGLSTRMIFRHVAKMIERVDPNLTTVAKLQNLTVEARRSLAERALLLEMELWDDRQTQYVSEEERTKFGRAS